LSNQLFLVPVTVEQKKIINLLGNPADEKRTDISTNKPAGTQLPWR